MRSIDSIIDEIMAEPFEGTNFNLDRASPGELVEAEELLKSELESLRSRSIKTPKKVEDKQDNNGPANA